MFTPQPDSRSGRADAENCQQHEPRSPEQPGNQTDNDNIPTLDWRVRRAVELMSEDLRRRWKVADLAKLVKLGPDHFATLFRRETGFAPLQFLKVMRLERARFLLAETFESVTQVAAEVGYDPEGKHFYHDFKAEYDDTPHAYRRHGGGPAGRDGGGKCDFIPESDTKSRNPTQNRGFRHCTPPPEGV
jgi:transcriptional regulator GlxA family with amidase domain